MNDGFNVNALSATKGQSSHLGSLTSEFALYLPDLGRLGRLNPSPIVREEEDGKKKNSREFCGQRNAVHIFAIAAAEVMRPRVGACRGEPRQHPACPASVATGPCFTGKRSLATAMFAILHQSLYL